MKRFILNALLIAGIALLGIRPAAAVMIDFVPTSHMAGDSIFAGEIVLVDVVVSDLGGNVVSAYDMDIAYDDTLLDPFQIIYHDNLGDWSLFETLRSDSAPFTANNDFSTFGLTLPGILDVAELSFLSDAELLALQGGNSVSLFTMDFDVIDDGVLGDFAFIWDEFNDVKGAGNRVIIPTIPEPGTLLLMAAATAGFGFSRRKQRV